MFFFGKLKFNRLRLLAALLPFIFLIDHAEAFAPRTYIWGLAGTEQLSRIDFMLPLQASSKDYFFYTDIQGEVDTISNWYAGLGLGLRGSFQNQVTGAYCFVDRNYTGRHHKFVVINPGLESLGQSWEARINGYLPFKKEYKKENLLPASDTCGDNFNCNQAIFIGHQEFLPKNFSYEEVAQDWTLKWVTILEINSYPFMAAATIITLSDRQMLKGWKHALSFRSIILLR